MIANLVKLISMFAVKYMYIKQNMRTYPIDDFFSQVAKLSVYM